MELLAVLLVCARASTLYVKFINSLFEYVDDWMDKLKTKSNLTLGFTYLFFIRQHYWIEIYLFLSCSICSSTHVLVVTLN